MKPKCGGDTPVEQPTREMPFLSELGCALEPGSSPHKAPRLALSVGRLYGSLTGTGYFGYVIGWQISFISSSAVI